MYTFTDVEIAQAILEARDKGVDIIVFFVQWFVHKQNTSQNILIWEHKRSNSIIGNYNYQANKNNKE